jgi:hypothetical protein
MSYNHSDLQLHGDHTRPMTGGLLETEAQRLQREADEYTKMLEHERK